MHTLAYGISHSVKIAVPGRYSLPQAMVLLLVLAALPLPAVGGKPADLTVEQAYMGLSPGPLRNARVVKLPKGVVLRSGRLLITSDQVPAAAKSGTPEATGPTPPNPFAVLEQVAVDSLLRFEARVWARVTEKDSNQEIGDPLVQAYLRSVADKAIVSDSELRAYYDESPDMFSGATFDQAAEGLRNYLQREKRTEATDQLIRTISERTLVEIDADWLKAPAAAALANPVDRARRSGKPTVVDFGADGCRPCDMMAPILEELRSTYTGKCNVLFTHVRQEPALAQRYGISVIPVQVFFDRQGREVFRNLGFYPKEQMLARMAEIGVK